MLVVRFKCDICQKHKKYTANTVCGAGTGFAIQIIDNQEKKICYDCIANLDMIQMDALVEKVIEGKKIAAYTLFIGHNSELGYVVCNRPCTLQYKIIRYKVTSKNEAKPRRDAWFKDHKGIIWHGVQYGNDNTVLKCKPLKNQNKFKEEELVI